MAFFKKKSVHCLTEPQLRDFFKQYLSNKDGMLTKQDLKEAFRRLGSMNPGWRAGRAIHLADIDDDGCITEAELDHLVHYAVEQGYRLRK